MPTACPTRVSSGCRGRAAVGIASGCPDGRNAPPVRSLTSSGSLDAASMERNALDLFSPIDFGRLHLENRVVMAPLTRLRSGEDGVPGPLVAEHYAQRASVGMIITAGVY